MMAIEVKQVNSDEALEFWEQSPHSSIFTHPTVLSRLSNQVDWWLAFKGQEPQCLWPVCFPDGEHLGLPDLTYYVGPLWSHEVFPFPAHRSLSRTTKVYESFIRQFLCQYGEIHACFPKGLHDMRVFAWWNYHQPQKPKFTIQPKYSACITDLQAKSDKEILSSYRQLRRRELRSINTDGPPPPTVNWTTDDIFRLYSDVLGRQGIDLEKEIEKKISAFISLVHDGYGEVIAYETPKTGETIAACLLLYGNNQANMVLNLVESTWRTSGLPAWMITEAIKTARANGLTVFDFNGANSPNRGDDKHSYGAEPVLFFSIKYPGE